MLSPCEDIIWERRILLTSASFLLDSFDENRVADAVDVESRRGRGRGRTLDDDLFVVASPS